MISNDISDREGPFDANLKPGLRTNNSESGSATVDPKTEKPVKDTPAAVADKVAEKVAAADKVVEDEKNRRKT